MSKKNVFYVYILTVMVFVSFTIGLIGETAKEGSLKFEYDALNSKFMEKMKSVNSREAYKLLMEERQSDLKALLGKFAEKSLTDEETLLKGKINFDLKNKIEANFLYDQLIGKKSPLTAQAKFEKVRVLLDDNKTNEALTLFREVENNVEKNNDFLWVLMEFSFSAADDKDKEEFSYKFLKTAGNKPEYDRFRVMAYNNLARLQKEKGNPQKGIEILEKAIMDVTSDAARAELNAALKQFKLYGSPAPEISAESWLNSEGALKLADLKGKPVIIDFWATWCNPCRQVIPVLIKNYNQLKDKGLVVIGFTRFYGNYSDELGNKGKVTPEEEIKLINEFVERNKITYPIAVSREKVTFEAYGISGIPTMIFIDKSGKIKEIEVGSGDQFTLEKKIKELVEN